MLRLSKKNKKPTESLRSTSIVKELGRGFYSKVYLAQTKGVFDVLVALKTIDNQSNNRGEDCILNEIAVLSNLAPQCNIIRLIGANSDERLVVLEYCVHGNLLDYIKRHKVLKHSLSSLTFVCHVN